MTTKATKGKARGAGKAGAPSSAARVEGRGKKARKKGAASQPKVAKGSAGTGGKGGGLH